VYFFGTIAVAAGLGVYGLGFQVRVGFGIGLTTGFEIGFGVALLPFCLAVMINLPVFGSV
jgi:hypothetical protein